MKRPSKLVLELRDLLQAHLDRHPNITIHGFSKKCGVATSTVRRILELETKEDPNPSTVLGIVSAISKEFSIQGLLDLYDGEIHNSLKRSFSFLSKFSYRPELSEVLSNRESYIIFKMAANDSGVDRNKIFQILGTPAVEKIEELLQFNLIYENHGVLHALEKNFLLPEDISKKHIPELLRFTHSNKKFSEKSIFKNISESINENCYYKIGNILREAIDKISFEISKKESKGDIPFFMTSVLDTMEPPNEIFEGQEVHSIRKDKLEEDSKYH